MGLGLAGAGHAAIADSGTATSTSHAPTTSAGQAPAGGGRASTDWPMYGHDAHRSFDAPTSLNALTAETLVPKWYFPTHDAVTAEPIVVKRTAYVGSWDGNFYALDADTGALRWSFTVDAQPAVFPNVTGRSLQNFSNDLTSDGGIITSTATFVRGAAARPDLVVFGAGYTLYALRATPGPLPRGTSRLYWKHAYTGRPEQAADPANDQTRIFSSPLIVGGRVLFGVSSDGERGKRGYFVSADLATGKPVWVFETDVNAAGHVLNDGCNGVWASATLDERDGLIFFGVADCHGGNPPPYASRFLALHLADGSLAWVFTPRRTDGGDPACDFDVGASANFGRLPNGAAFLGVGSKNGSYYALDPRTGHLRWATNVVYGGNAGGFIGTAAFDGRRIYAASAIGDIPTQCQQNLRDLPIEEPSIVSFDATGGAVRWTGLLAQSFSPTTVAGGLVFGGTAIYHTIEIHDAQTGVLIRVLPLPADSDSGIVVSGDTLYFGTGDNYQGGPSGVWAFAPAADLSAR